MEDQSNTQNSSTGQVQGQTQVPATTPVPNPATPPPVAPAALNAEPMNTTASPAAPVVVEAVTPAVPVAAPAPAVPAPVPEATAPPAKIEIPKKDEISDKLKLLQDSILSGNIPQMVMMAISNALDMRSSDIHIEPLEKIVRIRYRVDGVLMHIVEYPLNLHPAIVSRVKIMSNLKIDEQRIPQDGRADVTTKDGREMDLRVSTLPTVNGEKIVMRLQDKSRKIPDLPELGIAGIGLRNLTEALDSPNGIIINTGPTGSGKTTTLYSCLSRKNKMEVNILTIEDPVEIQLDGLNQSQVHHDIEYDFATGMRAALRQDPDIIMVGEIRDRETADTAIEASLTGHLVFSTLHTNSAVESITRMINMGVPPYLLNSTIEVIIAQRLVRRLCEKCKRVYEPDSEIMEIATKAMEALNVEGEIDPELVKNMKFTEAVGCDDCNNVGYKGRVGLYEVFRMSNDLRRLISESATTMDIQESAMKNGMVTLEQAGVIKALEGVTTLDEVYRVARKSV